MEKINSYLSFILNEELFAINVKNELLVCQIVAVKNVAMMVVVVVVVHVIAEKSVLLLGSAK